MAERTLATNPIQRYSTESDGIGWDTEYIKNVIRKRVEGATREQLAEALLEFYALTYPVVSVFESVVNPADEGTVVRSYLQPAIIGDDYISSRGDKIPDDRVMEWINAGDVFGDSINDDVQDAVFDPRVVMFASSGSVGAAAIINGTVTVGLMRALCEFHRGILRTPPTTP